MDSGKDISDACALSGEPIIPHLESLTRQDTPPATINQVWELQLEKAEYQKTVLDMWNATAERTKSGKPMDAFIMPVAPFAAVVHNQYDDFLYTTWVWSSE